MVKRKANKRRKCHAARIKAPDQARPSQQTGLPHEIKLAIATYWTPEQAIAVFELVDDLRESIWSFYQTKLQDLISHERQWPPVNPIAIDDDLPF